MEMIKAAGEEEMVALFLRSEWSSSRFGAELRQIVDDEGKPAELVTQPNLESGQDNAARRGILAKLRGLGRDEDAFEGFRRPRRSRASAGSSSARRQRCDTGRDTEPDEAQPLSVTGAR